MGKLTILVGSAFWALIAGYIYVLWKLWEATLSSASIIVGVANLILFVILFLLGFLAIPALFVLGLAIMAE